MSEAEQQADQQAPAPAEPGPEPGTPEPPRLRRRPFGYRRADVDRALETRDSQLVELRQDIAALWLAFAQHDRMIRELGGTPRPSVPPSAPQEPAAPQAPGEDTAGAMAGQLSDLDEVLAAIEMATQTLERTYTDEADPDQPAGTEPGSPGEAPEQGGRTGAP